MSYYIARIKIRTVDLRIYHNQDSEILTRETVISE